MPPMIAATLLLLGTLLVGSALHSESNSECRCGGVAFSCFDARFVDCYSGLLARFVGVDFESRLAEMRVILGATGMGIVALAALKVLRPSRTTSLRY